MRGDVRNSLTIRFWQSTAPPIRKMQQSVVNWVLLITLVIVYAEPRYGGYPTGYPFGYPTGYPTGYPAHYPIGYPTSYRTPFIPGFRQYPPAPQKPQSFSPNGRIFFLESTVYVTTTSLSLVTCTYSTAALSSCRKRRNILLGDDEEFIAPSEVVRYYHPTMIWFLLIVPEPKR